MEREPQHYPQEMFERMNNQPERLVVETQLLEEARRIREEIYTVLKQTEPLRNRLRTTGYHPEDQEVNAVWDAMLWLENAAYDGNYQF